MRRFVPFSLLCAAAPAAAWEWDTPNSAGAPAARQGHSMTLFTPANGKPRMVTCGGVDANGAYLPSGCWSLDPFAGWKFTTVVASNDTAARVDHTSVIFGSYMVIWGGVISPDASPTLYPPAGCEVIATGVWKPAVGGGCTQGSVPVPRWGHSAVLWQDQWIVFGGAALDDGSGNSTDFNDAVSLDLSAMPVMTWIQPSGVLNPPPARHWHAAAIFGTSMLVYGGFSFALNDVLDDLWIVPLYGPDAWTWSMLTPSNPTPLYGHRATVVGSIFVMYGGHISSAGGVYAVDLSSGGAVWSTPTVEGEWLRAPFRSAIATFDADGDNDPEVVVFGGARVDIRGVINGLAVLSQVGQVPLQVSAELPFILGGAACGAFLLLSVGYMAYRRSKALAARREREMEVSGPLLAGVGTAYGYNSGAGGAAGGGLGGGGVGGGGAGGGGAGSADGDERGAQGLAGKAGGATSIPLMDEEYYEDEEEDDVDARQLRF
jgi:hypothetical protein